MSAAPYREQVSLLLRVLPIIEREEAFALKGGTAINLFVRDLPRLSVDIDLTFLPLVDRGASLTAIHEALQRVAIWSSARSRGRPSTRPVEPMHLSSSSVDEVLGSLLSRMSPCGEASFRLGKPARPPPSKRSSSSR